MNAMLKDAADRPGPPLAARDLGHGYEGATVLRGIDLDIAAGSVLGLIGRNGAGKSTLLRALLGLLEPTTGETRVFGKPALAMDDGIRQRIAYVPQQPEALAWLTVAQMFDYLGRFYPRWNHAFARDTLARWQLPANKLFGKLSPGERQRVELVRALASEPELLVLDEPAAALDPVARRELLREIALRACEAGITVVFSTHIVSDLERVASDIAFLHQGRLLLHCPVDDTKERYARLWLPARLGPHAPASTLGRRSHADCSVSVVIERDAHGRWPDEAAQPGVRLDVLGLEDLFVEIAE